MSPGEARKLELLAILERAAAEPLGLLLRTSDTQKARAALYTARRESGNPDLAILQIRISPFPDGDLVVVRGAERPKSGVKPLSIEDLEL